MLDERKAAILAALVEDYIESGAPVSSRAILERSGLDCSSATIRNELAALERDGYVLQPHTSAGRIPSDRGYRYYVDHLSPESLRASTRGRIDTFFGTMQVEFSRILRETSELLSDITRYPSVVLGPGLRDEVVRDTHLLPIDPESALFVVVCESGRVHQSVLRLATAATDSEMRRAAEVIDETVIGHRLGDQIGAGGPELPQAVDGIVLAALDAVVGAAETSRDIFVGGTSRLAELWEDLAKLHRVLALLERDAALLRLLGDRSEGTSVRLGPELGSSVRDLAVVSAGYRTAGAAGRVGVLGPMRMDYRRTIRVVEEVSDALGDSLKH